MADTVFKGVIPDLKAVDYGDGTYLMAVSPVTAGAGDDTVFDTIPPLKAINLDDGTYAISVVVQ